ncbi:mediator of DNA damage checkpoint protein 1 [Drosophila biarmipes]|uniref:mediator of DNA damage checkpoint protein 1 n=1 Tax=Drosophila biarmipes TaxID=125945 RepID=UPI0007E8359C|nr:mediator of DNA damage checkpoint protein 1 [Drosophila biarmipes]
MADVSLAVEGLPAIPLKPDIIYRIGRKKGLEISVADESMELAHATACILRRGVVRLAALVGRMFVNDQEQTIVDIGKEDTLAGQVKLRFGNVEARLEIKEDNYEAHDSSGFGECLKNRSINSTLDSFDIPETQPPSANTTVNTTADSFFIPETQAIVLDRPRTSGKVSLGDDFMIPETQDLLAKLPPVHPMKPALNPQDQTIGSDGESSQGSMIRMCTQDYNEDAIDDFDSSQVLCDALLPLPPPPTKPMESLEKEIKRDQLNTTDLEMSALNWSASNSKCCALSSTKADEVLPREDACITPELTAPSTDRNICTPDLFDLILGRDGRADSCSPDPFVRPADRGNTTTPQFGGVKQLVVATIETPTATPDKEIAERSPESNQDMIVTQRFPGYKLLESDAEDNELPNQDFVATQAFNLTRRQPNEVPEPLKDNETNQDFIATQAFNLRLQPTKDSPKPPKANESSNQDFIETQVFDLGRPLPTDSPEPPKENETSNQDFIATQAFPALINNIRCQDFIATQPFHVVKQHSTSLSNKENILHDVGIQGSGSKASEEPCDEIDAVLNEMVSGTVVTSPINPNEEAIKFFKPCVIKDKNHYQKICQIEGVFSDLSNKSRWRTEATNIGSRKRVAKSVSPPATPSRKNRRISEGSQRLESNVRKRRANSVDKNSEPLSKSICQEHEMGSIAEEKSKDDEGEAPFKKVASQWQDRRNRKVSTELEDKSKEEPPAKRKRGRKAQTAETSETDTLQDIPKPTTRHRSKTNDEDAGAEKPTKSKSAGARTTRQTSIEDAEMSVKPASGRKVKKTDSAKDIPKPTIKTRRQTSEEDAGTTSADKEKSVKGTPKDIPKPTARSRRKASEENTETAKAENPVKPKRGRKPKSEETSKADASVDKPLPRTRRKTVVEDVDPPKEEKPAGTSIKRAVVRLSRTTIDQADTSSNSGHSSKATRAANSRSATPSIEEPSSSSAAAKASNVSASGLAPRATRVAKSRSNAPSVDDLLTTSATAKEPKKKVSREEPSASSVHSKKTKNLAEEEGVRNRSGATTTRFSQPDPDPIKAFNKYVRKAKTAGKIKVAFTMCNRQALESVLKSLKHVVETTEDPLECDMLIMDKGERTYKFLAVIAANKPVLSSNWLHSVKKTRSLDIKADHLFSDAKFMETFKFKPLSVLEHPRLLFGLHFMLGEDIIPKAIEMKAIIQSAGGKVHAQPPSLAISMDLYVVTTSKDTKSKRRMSNHEKVHFIKTEAIMQALVRHNVELLNEFKLNL